MAAENPLMDNKQFTCAICIGQYNNPRYLPICGHTFCENCLLKYTRKIQQEGQVSKFDCPVCRKPNILPEHDEVTLQWVQTFPLNTAIINMMATLPQYSVEKNTEQIICDPCKEEGETIDGFKFCFDCKEMLCKPCTKYHKKVKSLKTHKLLDLTEMPTETSHTDFFQVVGKCIAHQEREVEIYCKTHDIVICLLCSTFQHTDCDLIELTGHYIDGTKTKKKSDRVINQMKATIEHLEYLQNLRLESKTNFKQKLKEIRENTNQARAQVVKLMDNAVTHVAEVTKQMEIEKEDGIDAEMAKVAKIKERMEQNVALLDTMSQHGSDKQKFVSTHNMMTEFEEISKQIQEEDKRLTQLDAKLVIADDVKKLMDNTDVKPAQIKVIESLSSHRPLLSVLHELKNAGIVKNELMNCQLVKAEEFTICRDKGRDPWYGVSVCNDGRITLSDYNTGGYLHVFNPANRHEQKLKMIGDPSCAVQIDDTHLAVCLQDKQAISIVAFGNELKEEKIFDTKNKPFTMVALTNGLLAVAWQSPYAFGVVDISGTELVEKSYMEHDKIGRVFETFEYLAVDESRQHVIQPCFKERAVFCFDFTGNPVFEYNDPGMSNPRGAAVDKCGNIYVNERKYNTIHKLSPAGDPISIITDIMVNIWTICTDLTGTGFFVTRNTPRENVVYFRLEQNVSEMSPSIL